MTRLDDIIGLFGNRVIAIAGFTLFAAETHKVAELDHARASMTPEAFGFEALKQATLYSDRFEFKRWDVGAESFDEVVENVKRSAVERYSFPYRPKTVSPA
jgi:hypothetical protein